MSQQQVTTGSCQMENNDRMHDITSQEIGVVLCYATDCLPHYCLAGCTLSWVHSVCNNLSLVVVSSQMIVLPVCLLQCRHLQNLCYYWQILSHPLNCYLCHAVFALRCCKRHLSTVHWQLCQYNMGLTMVFGKAAADGRVPSRSAAPR